MTDTPRSTEAGGIEAPVRRRGMLGMLSKGGIALVAGVAGVLATASPAEADCQHSPCCHLASCRICPNECDYRCPSGYNAKMWTCAPALRDRPRPGRPGGRCGGRVGGELCRAARDLAVGVARW
jgi:hypothetical protein